MTADAARAALITGAAGGLGGEVVRTFLDAGFRVVAVDVGVPVLDAPADRYLGVGADLATEAGARDMVEAALDRFGRIDALLNLVGGWQGGAPLWETSPDDWERMFTLNLRTAFLATRAALPSMIERRAGRLVFVGSRTAVLPAANQAAYNAAKAAVIALCQSVAQEARPHGITANCVLPSVIDTPANRRAMPQADPSRWVGPRGLAEVLLFLSTDASREITGAAIPVYGRI